MIWDEYENYGVDDQDIKELRMFGRTIKQIKMELDEVSNVKMYVIGMLSDIQEIMANPYIDNEVARLKLNKAKYVIDNCLKNA